MYCLSRCSLINLINPAAVAADCLQILPFAFAENARHKPLQDLARGGRRKVKCCNLQATGGVVFFALLFSGFSFVTASRERNFVRNHHPSPVRSVINYRTVLIVRWCIFFSPSISYQLAAHSQSKERSHTNRKPVCHCSGGGPTLHLNWT